MNEPDRSEQLRMMLFIMLALLVFLITSHYFKPPVQPATPDQNAVTSPGPATTGAGTSGNPRSRHLDECGQREARDRLRRCRRLRKNQP